MVAVGLLLGIFGAHFSRGIITVLLGAIGTAVGIATARNHDQPAIAGGLLGLACFAICGFFAHRLWVGAAIGLLACGLASFLYAHKAYWSEWQAYQPVPARSEVLEFEVPGEQQVRTTPLAYLRGFHDHLSSQRPDASKRALALAAVTLIAGFAWGAWFTRGALIAATACAGTLLFTAGLGALAETLAPEGWGQGLPQHPKLTLGFLGACFLLSVLVQYRFTQAPESSPPPKQPTE
jgi:hypothetical protein